MSTTEKRLDALGSVLTVRERLTLVMRGWLNDEQWDERLVRFIPPSDKQEYDELVRVIENTNSNLMQILAFNLEWLRNLEMEVSRFLIIDAVLKHCSPLPELPPPVLGFVSDLPSLWGTSVSIATSPPRDWQEARDRMLDELQRGFGTRCDELLAVEETLAALSEAFDEPMGHQRLLTAFPPFRAKLQQIGEALGPFGGDWTIPVAPSERARELIAAHAPRDKFPKRASQARTLPAAQREEVEGYEAEAAAALRAERKSR